MVSGEDFDDGDAVGIVASDIDDDVAAREKVTTRCGDDVAGANAIVIIGTARRRSRNDHVVNIFITARPQAETRSLSLLAARDSSLFRSEKNMNERWCQLA